jgi:hypothetical protein
LLACFKNHLRNETEAGWLPETRRRRGSSSVGLGNCR